MPRTPTTIDPAEIVGCQEIALRLQVEPQTVNSWRKRAAETRARTAPSPGGRTPLPEPDGHVGDTPWWLWTATILPWATSTGRTR
jgi:hypothetical protein